MKARHRIALAGALLAALFLLLLGLGARALLRRNAVADIDEELTTLAAAIGSDFEVEGLDHARREALEAGLRANTLEFRLNRHSAILFFGERPFAMSADLVESGLSGGLGPYRQRGEVPYTSLEPYSGQRHISRFLVTRLEGRAAGATLVLFRPVEADFQFLAGVDRALALFVLVGFLGTAVLLAAAVHRALRPVEEVTRLAEEAQAADLSRRVRMPRGGEEFRRLAAVINSLFERLESAFSAQRRLVADAAHELKTPAAVLLGEAQEAAREEVSPEERRRSLGVIASTARAIAHQIDALLVLARGDAAPPVAREPVELGELAEDAAAAVGGLAVSRGVRLRLVREGGSTVLGERESLGALARNLIANAVQYSDPGAQVEVLTGARDGSCYLEVRDQGPGVAPEDVPQIFVRFVRLEEGRLRNPEGSGLGLSIVEQVARRHGGHVEVDSRIGGGAMFRAVLPPAKREGPGGTGLARGGS
jgi:signal transduction histidine kinase